MKFLSTLSSFRKVAMGYFFRGAIMTERADRGAIILAAGLGTRMKSERAKVLHEVFYRPMRRRQGHDCKNVQGHKEPCVVVSCTKITIISKMK